LQKKGKAGDNPFTQKSQGAEDELKGQTGARQVCPTKQSSHDKKRILRKVVTK